MSWEVFALFGFNPISLRAVSRKHSLYIIYRHANMSEVNWFFFLDFASWTFPNTLKKSVLKNLSKYFEKICSETTWPLPILRQKSNTLLWYFLVEFSPPVVYCPGFQRGILPHKARVGTLVKKMIPCVFIMSEIVLTCKTPAL